MSHIQDRSLDILGITLLSGFAIFFGFNQVVIKWTNAGLSPIFMVGLRSAGAAVVIALWIWLSPRLSWPDMRHWRAGLALGLWFTFEFYAIFLALDYTTVTRASIFFYTMPIWVAVMGHFILPDDRLNRYKLLGMLCAFGGVALSMLHRPEEGGASLLGDILALMGGIGWAGVALTAKSSVLSKQAPEHGLLWQLVVSAVFFLISAPLFGPLIREWEHIYFLGMFFHIFLVASGGFLMWLWLLKRYSASTVVSFSFISPIASVGFGVYLLNEPFSWVIVLALVMVCAGLFLVNKRPSPPSPTKAVAVR